MVNMEYVIIFGGLGISIGVNFFLLLTRNKKGSENFRWILSLTIMTVGIIVFYQSTKELKAFLSPFLWQLSTPFIYNLIDLIFKKLSIMIYNRDFILQLRGTSELEGNTFPKHYVIKWTDKFFSIILLFIIVFLPFIGIPFVNDLVEKLLI